MAVIYAAAPFLFSSLRSHYISTVAIMAYIGIIAYYYWDYWIIRFSLELSVL